MNPKESSTIPDPVRMAFEAEPFLSTSALASALGWDIKTLRRHCDAGNLRWRQKGLGSKRLHRVITIEDFRAFWERIQCQFTGIRNPRLAVRLLDRHVSIFRVDRCSEGPAQA